MNPLVSKIRDEIQGRGPVSFARFMELALYSPSLGYYERQQEIGRKGDFMTSVSVGPVFGELLAFQFADWLRPLLVNRRNKTVQIVEAGAHQGQLASDILNWFHKFAPDICSSLEYWIIEPSSVHQQWQRSTLQAETSSNGRQETQTSLKAASQHGSAVWQTAVSPIDNRQPSNKPESNASRLPTGDTADYQSALRAKVNWANSITDFSQTGIHGIIFSNELLDAMPVHRLRWNASDCSWQEWLIDLSETGFAWTPAPLDPALQPFLPEVPPELAQVLPDGFTTEISPAAISWWRSAAEVLSEGKLLTIDYGFSAEEFLQPHRSKGTLRAYFKHHVSEDILANPGEQDLTAHVNFSAIREAGERAKLQTSELISQAYFLTQIFEQTLKCPESFPKCTPTRIRQFQTLVHPEHMGRPFQVLVQDKRE